MLHTPAFKYETFGDSYEYARSVPSETVLALTEMFITVPLAASWSCLQYVRQGFILLVYQGLSFSFFNQKYIFTVLIVLILWIQSEFSKNIKFMW